MKLLPDINKHGSVTDTLEKDQLLMVQIVKEPISSKRSAPYHRDYFHRTFSGADTIQRQDFNIAENKDHRGKGASASVGGEYTS